MTAIVIAAMTTNAETAPALDTTITSMGNQIYYADTVESFRVYGYENGVNYYNYSGINGTIGSASWVDGTSTTRTISGLYYHESGAPVSESDDLVFSLNATGISDSDSTFRILEYNGVTYTRSSRNTFSSTVGSATSWIWTNINPNGPTSGNPTVRIFL